MFSKVKENAVSAVNETYRKDSYIDFSHTLVGKLLAHGIHVKEFIEESCDMVIPNAHVFIDGFTVDGLALGGLTKLARQERQADIARLTNLAETTELAS